MKRAMLKRIISVMLVLLILFNIKVSYAEDDYSQSLRKMAKISEEQALSTAKYFIEYGMGISLENRKVDIRISKDFNRGLYWEVTIKDTGNEYVPYCLINISAISGKVLIALNVKGSEAYRKATSEEEIRESSKEMLIKLVPDIVKDIREDKNLEYCDENIAMLSYVRNVNGIDYGGNYIAISIDRRSSKITSYVCQWDEEANFPPAEIGKSKEEMNSFLTENIVMKPYYTLKEGYFNNVKSGSLYLIPVYKPCYLKGNYVDAKSKEETYLKDKFFDKINIEGVEKTSFLAKAKEGLKKGTNLNDLPGIVGKILKTYTDKTLETSKYTLKMDNDRFVITGKNTEEMSFSAGINCDTGELMNFLNAEGEGDNHKEFDFDIAYKKAIGVIGNVFPEKIRHIDTAQSKNGVRYEYEIDKNYYSFEFMRMENGGIYEGDRISIKINKKTGNLFTIGLVWHNELKFPKFSGGMSPELAKGKYLKLANPCVQYVNLNNDKLEKPDIRLAYKETLVDGMYIKAYTGELTTFSDPKVYFINNSFEKKVETSFNKDELSVLAYRDIIDMESFNLKKKVTRLDIIKMLVNYRGYKPYSINEKITIDSNEIKKDSVDYKYLQLACMYGIVDGKIKNIKLLGNITREEFCEYMVKASEYRKLIELSKIMKLKAKDLKAVSKNRTGYVAAVKELQILDLEDAIRPKVEMNMEEAAMAIYKLMDLEEKL